MQSIFPSGRHVRAFERATRSSSSVRRARALVVAVVCAMAAVLDSPNAHGATTRYDDAHVDYEVGHYERAFAVFASLADEGHCDAARLALQMVRHGRKVYGVDFSATPERLGRWQLLASCKAAPARAVP